MTRQTISWLAVLTLALSVTGGCDWVREKLGLGYMVVAPEEESPEWVVQQVLKASTMEPFEDAWAEYQKYLHSSELTPAALQSWETLRFPALRRKHTCFLRTEEGEYAYEVKERVEERDDYMQLRVSCKTTDVPTPCHLFQDPEQGGKWRIKMNCLN